MQIAKPFGIPLRLHWSFVFLVVGLCAYGVANLGWPRGLIFGGVTTATLFLSVVLHEYGHALAARRFGIGTHHITLYPMGGAAAIERMPEEPDQEAVIALAGPATNILLAIVAGWAWLLTSHPYALMFTMLNGAMGLFNLIPAFPMDGGRVLRAVLAKRMGWMRASRTAVRVGRAFVWVFLGVGLLWQQWELLLMSMFLHVSLNAEEKRLVAMHWEATTGRPAPWMQDDDASALPEEPSKG
ncbi:MAG: site-2 protease family protein [Myxococcota bacterium]